MRVINCVTIRSTIHFVKTFYNVKKLNKVILEMVIPGMESVFNSITMFLRVTVPRITIPRKNIPRMTIS